VVKALLRREFEDVPFFPLLFFFFPFVFSYIIRPFARRTNCVKPFCPVFFWLSPSPPSLFLPPSFFPLSRASSFFKMKRSEDWTFHWSMIALLFFFLFSPPLPPYFFFYSSVLMLPHEVSGVKGEKQMPTCGRPFF